MAWQADDDPGGPDRSWDLAPKGGWDAFRAARDVFLLGLAVDTALHGVELDPGPAYGVTGWYGDPD